MKLILSSGAVYVILFLGGIALIQIGKDIGWALAVASQGMLGFTGFLLGSLNQKKTMMDTADIIIRSQVADVAKTKAMAGLVGTAYKQAAVHFRAQPQQQLPAADWDSFLPGDFKLLSIGDDDNV